MFTYETELRSNAANMLPSSNSADRIPARETRKAAYAEVDRLMNEAASGDINALVLDGSDPNAQRWILENQEVAGMYGGFSPGRIGIPGGPPGPLTEAPPNEK